MTTGYAACAICGLFVFSLTLFYYCHVPAPNIDTIVSLAKRRGFVFPSSEVYGGLGSAWDYGPLGVELCNNVKQSWWRWLVYERDDIEGIDSSIILNRLVWKYSGHEATFHDPLVDCRECKSRMRADKLEGYFPEGGDRVFDANARLRGGLVKCAELRFDEPDRRALLQHDVSHDAWALLPLKTIRRRSPICVRKLRREFSSTS